MPTRSRSFRVPFPLETAVAGAFYDVAPGVVKSLRSRRGEFQSDLEMELMAVGIDPYARSLLMGSIADEWKRASRRKPPADCGELVIGAGIHGTVYATTRHLSGHPRPLLVERDSPYGPFRGSPWFDLNSRNRAGSGGMPGENAGLNYLPGAPIQMAMLGSAEYQSNADLAFVLGISQAMHAQLCKATVYDVVPALPTNTRRKLAVHVDDGRIIYTDRVIDARGLGDPRDDDLCDGKRVMNIHQFGQRMSQPFPLRDLGRVAIVGGGDTAKVAAEALLGIGPGNHMSVPGLDQVDQVDWFTDTLPGTCESWRDRVRGRYQRLGSFLRPVANGLTRLRIIPRRPTLQKTLNEVLLDGRTYDHVIVATGWKLPAFDGTPEGVSTNLNVNGYTVARTAGRSEAEGLMIGVGPAANIAFSNLEPYSSNPDNKVAIFRLAPRTSILALDLPAVPETVLPVPKAPKVRTPRQSAIVPPAIGKDSEGNDVFVGSTLQYDGKAGRIRVTANAAFGGGFQVTPLEDRADGLGRSGFSADTERVVVVPFADPVVRGPFILKDVNGVDIYEGDYVKHVPSGMTGTAVLNRDGSGNAIQAQPLVMLRDDGLTGTGPGGAYRFGDGSNKLFVRVWRDGDLIGCRDSGDRQLVVGDRVRIGDYGSQSKKGVVIGARLTAISRILVPDVRRDDGQVVEGNKTGGMTFTASRLTVITPFGMGDPNRQFLITGSDGRNIYEGDRIVWESRRLGKLFPGVAVPDAVNGAAIVRDDGRRGGGVKGAFRFNIGRNSNRYRLEEPPTSADANVGDDVLGMDTAGSVIRLGTRVSVTDRFGPYTGRAFPVSEGFAPSRKMTARFSVDRDDRIGGGDDDGRWALYDEVVTRVEVVTPQTRFIVRDTAEKAVYEGDRVRVTDNTTYEGQAVYVQIAGVSNLGVKRDDGSLGSGPEGAWTISKINERSVTRL